LKRATHTLAEQLKYVILSEAEVSQIGLQSKLKKFSFTLMTIRFFAIAQN